MTRYIAIDWDMETIYTCEAENLVQAREAISKSWSRVNLPDITTLEDFFQNHQVRRES